MNLLERDGVPGGEDSRSCGECAHFIESGNGSGVCGFFMTGPVADEDALREYIDRYVFDWWDEPCAAFIPYEE